MMDKTTNGLLAYYMQNESDEPPVIPTEGLVSYTPLDTWTGADEQGHAYTYRTDTGTPVLPVATVYRNVPCCAFPDKAWYTAYVPQAAWATAYTGTLSFWLASDTSFVMWRGASNIVAFGAGNPNAQENYWGAAWLNNGVDFVAGAFRIPAGTYTTISGDVTRWHHVCMRISRPNGWEYVTYSADVYIDGMPAGSVAYNCVNNNLGYIRIGNVRTSGSYRFMIAGVRLYNRTLSPQEIIALSQEYNPV